MLASVARQRFARKPREGPDGRFVEVRTPKQVDLQALHRIRGLLVGQRTGLMNQARAFCIEYGLAMRIGAGSFHADIRRPLANPENDLTQNMRALLNDLLDDLATIEGRVKALSARIEAIANEGETIRRLLTIPGIGALGAPALAAAAGDGRQFRKANSARRVIWRPSLGLFRRNSQRKRDPIATKPSLRWQIN